MAVGGSGKGIQIVVGTDYNGKDLARAQRDLDRLKGKAAASQGPMQKLGNTIRSNLGPALAMAGAAAGAFAIKLGVDGVKAAIADQKTVEVLAQTLQNLGQAHRQAGVEEFVASLESAYGVVDEELRPALGLLLTATGDVDEAQRRLQQAMDISVGTGQSLTTVVRAFQRALATGNAGSLSRYGIIIDENIVKTQGFGAALDAAASKFSGVAEREAKTLEGRLRILGVEIDNVKEAFGYGFLSGLGDVTGEMDSFTDSVRELKPMVAGLGEQIGTLVKALGDLEKHTGFVSAAFKGFLDVTGPTLDAILYFYRVMVLGEDPMEAFKQQFFGLGEAGEAAAAGVKAVGSEFGGGDWLPEATGDFGDLSASVEDAESALSDLNNEMKSFFGILDDRGALRDYQASVDDLRKSLKENGKSFDINTEAGRDNQAALDDIYDSALKVAEGQATAAQKVKTMQDASTEANKVLEQMGVPKEVRDALLKPFDDAIIAFQTATAGARNLKAEMERLPTQKTFNYDIVVTGADSIPPHQRAAGGPIFGVGRTRGSDTVPAMLTPGEFVIRRQAVKKFGADTFAQLNRGINPLAGMTPQAGSRGGGFTINGGITVNTMSGEGAEISLPRALRRMAFLAGVNG